MAKSKTAKITVKAVSVVLTDFHIKKKEEAGATKEVREHETPSGERVQG